MEENMANILVSGLINTETTVRVRQFPVNYYPIDYPFFGGEHRRVRRGVQHFQSTENLGG